MMAAKRERGVLGSGGRGKLKNFNANAVHEARHARMRILYKYGRRPTAKCTQHFCTLSLGTYKVYTIFAKVYHALDFLNYYIYSYTYVVEKSERNSDIILKLIII